MSTKDAISRLIAKRRKRCLYNAIDDMQFALGGTEAPHNWAIGMDARWVPQSVYRDWFEWIVNRYGMVKLKCEPRDHEWLLGMLLK